MSYLLRLVACLFILLSINVFAVDTDGDGFSDADEAALGTDPNDPTSPLENKLFSNDANRNQFDHYIFFKMCQNIYIKRCFTSQI